MCLTDVLPVSGHGSDCILVAGEENVGFTVQPAVGAAFQQNLRHAERREELPGRAKTETHKRAHVVKSNDLKHGNSARAPSVSCWTFSFSFTSVISSPDALKGIPLMWT